MIPPTPDLRWPPPYIMSWEEPPASARLRQKVPPEWNIGSRTPPLPSK